MQKKETSSWKSWFFILVLIILFNFFVLLIVWAYVYIPEEDDLNLNGNDIVNAEDIQANESISSKLLYTVNGTSDEGISHISIKNKAQKRYSFVLQGDEDKDNVGSNLQLWRYDDDGKKMDSILSLNRSTGQIIWTHPNILPIKDSLTTENTSTYQKGSFLYVENCGEDDKPCLAFFDGTHWRKSNDPNSILL